MGYTTSMMRMSVNYIIPFADKLPGLYQHTRPKISKKEEENRLRVARSMQKAILHGELGNEHSIATHQMINKAKSKIADLDFTSKKYLLDQAEKSANLVDYVVPGIASTVKPLITMNRVNNLTTYVQEAPQKESLWIRTGVVVMPIIVSTTSSIWRPFLTEQVLPTLYEIGTSLI